MHYIYGFANGNITQVCQVYQEGYPNKEIPSEITLLRTHAGLCKIRSLKKYNQRPDRLGSKTKQRLKDSNLQEIQDFPWIVFLVNLLHPYLKQ